MIKLSKEQVLKLHTQLIEATGGSNGIRDEKLLDSALNNPFQSFNGKKSCCWETFLAYSFFKIRILCILSLFLMHNYAIIVSKKGVKHYAAYYAY